MRSQVLFIGGRSGAGKTTGAIALHERLKASRVHHAVLEGDYLDLAHPAPHLAFADAKLAERNLRALWANYRELGYRRLIYTNTASVLSVESLAEAMGDDPEVTAVLLRAGDRSAAQRLNERAQGSVSQHDLDRSAATATLLDAKAPGSVHRLDTDRLGPAEVAARLAELIRWPADPVE